MSSGKNAERHQQEGSSRIICEGQIKMPYSWPAGRAGSRFLRALRDDTLILGLRCPSCRKVWVPPSRCLACDRTGTEWVEVGPLGTLETWTVVRTAVPSIQILPVPYAMGVIRLDGADTGLVHFLGVEEFSRLFSGLRVEPVFNTERRGHILDIRYFRPARSPAGG